MGKRVHRRRGDKRTKTQQGLGYAHQKARLNALAEMAEGTKCWRCKKPMYSWMQLHLDHVVSRAIGGVNGPTRLTHASCNMRAGQRLKTQLYGANVQRGPKRKRKQYRW